MKSDIRQGFEDRQAFRHPIETERKRWELPLTLCRHLVEDTARRVEASREEFSAKFFRGDCHSHTQHSDGIGTVAETAMMAKAAGLDFQFVTDHWGVTQKAECAEHGLWVGMEPGTEIHHMGILGIDHAFEPQGDLLADFAAAAELGATVFVPHPAGWWPKVVYKEEWKSLLETLPAPFLMEICNGANNIVSAFDYTDDSAIRLWDQLLCSGRQIHAMGNTDAHAPHAIGIIWNGVFAETCDQKSILAALGKGRSFVSDAPLIHIQIGQFCMGERVPKGVGENVLQVTAVDSRGLNSVRVIGDGQELFYQHLRGNKCFKGSVKVPARISSYIRVEAFSEDGKRAYSNPIYL